MKQGIFWLTGEDWHLQLLKTLVPHSLRPRACACLHHWIAERWLANACTQWLVTASTPPLEWLPSEDRPDQQKSSHRLQGRSRGRSRTMPASKSFKERRPFGKLHGTLCLFFLCLIMTLTCQSFIGMFVQWRESRTSKRYGRSFPARYQYVWPAFSFPFAARMLAVCRSSLSDTTVRSTSQYWTKLSSLCPRTWPSASLSAFSG